MNAVRLVLVDDHSIVRQGLHSILDPDPGFEVVGEAGSGAEALRLIEAAQPDIVLLDLKLPDVDGVQLCRQIGRISPGTAAVILTAFIDQHLVDAAVRAGARGYLLKNAEDLHLAERLRAVVQGQVVVDPRAAAILTGFVRSSAPVFQSLTPRETEVLLTMALGLTNKEIAVKLDLSENTIKGYVKEILGKMGVRNRVEAIASARQNGLL
jgi:DNA-binding NarL/FixJ family response regulator